MLIKEVCEKTGLTKKAINYYLEKGLISSDILENGYRDFSDIEIDKLMRISMLRKLDISISQIRIILESSDSEIIKDITIRKKLVVDRRIAEQVLLDRLSSGAKWDDINSELKALEQSKTITERVLDAFPGYFGRVVCLHFSQFLNMPITTPEQKKAYREIIRYLDSIPAIDIDEDIKELLRETTGHISINNMSEISEKSKQSIDNMEEFFNENQGILRDYIDFKKSDEYKDSAAYKLQQALRDLYTTNGYYDVFIPAMKKLSPSYASYCLKLEKANKELLLRYPEIKEIEEYNK